MPEIIDRLTAMERGRSWYFTGKPCKHGHIARRYLSNNYCYECARDYTYDTEYRARPEAKANRFIRANPECKPHREKIIALYRGKQKCDICGTKKLGKGRSVFSVDHCHKTSKIRGLLCDACNTTVRNHTAKFLRKAADYVERGGFRD